MPGLNALRRRFRRRDGHESPVESDDAAAGNGGKSPVESLLVDATIRLELIATASREASSAIRSRVDADADTEVGPPTRDLMGTLVERMEAMEAEALRIAALLHRTRGSLVDDRDRDPNGGGPGGNGHDGPSRPSEEEDEDRGEPEVDAGQVQRLVVLLAGAGASRPEIAAWVFREHGVVVSARALDELPLAERAGTT